MPLEDHPMRARLIASLTAGALALTIAAAPVAARSADNGNNIVAVAVALNASGPYAGQFDTLIAAVLAADPAVLSTLTSKGKLTVFAPTDGAFADLGLTPANVGSLPAGFLADVLTYHVARGERLAEDVVTSSRIRTLERGFLKVDGATLTDALGRDAHIIATDVLASNGVIHAIDAVVLPYAP
jgi:uncharacterized surface protein with fasciclin (FAS1) repeats